MKKRLGRGETNSWLMKCLKKKEEKGWKDLYNKERKKYYNRNGTCALDALKNDEERDMKIIDL